MRVVLVHDYLNQYGGAERVLEALHDLFPAAPIYTSIYDPRVMPAAMRDWDIRTSFMQRLPAWRQLFRFYLPLYPLAFESFDLNGYDLILSSSSSFAKGVLPPDGSRHICYCHNPPRFLWRTFAYLEHERVGGRLIQALLLPMLHRLRIWDVSASVRVGAWMANSRNVAGRIERYYGRESTIIHPPVDVLSFPVAQESGSYFLAGGRLIPYKRVDLAVSVCSRLGLPLVVYGDGRDRARLQELAGPSVQFTGWVSEERLRQLYLGCRAFIFPGEEDFGIAPVEAMASGRPVLAYAAGGALETVVADHSGLFFRRQDTEALVEVLQGFQDDAFEPAAIRAHAEQFGIARFQQQIQQFVQRSTVQGGTNVRP